MRTWLTKTLSGCIAADEDSAKVLSKFPVGTTFEADIVTRNVRSTAWNRRYWLLMSMLASNVERVNIIREDVGEWVMQIHNAEDMHEAIKYLTGHYEREIFNYKGRTLVMCRPKSIAFDKMSAEEWSVYWLRVLDAVHQRILPGVEEGAVEEELARLAS